VRLFDFARAYEMLGVEELANIDVGKAFSDAASLITDLKGVALIDDCHGLTVLADSLLQQLFYNLIDNSLKYGERTKRITIRFEKDGQGDLELIYEDDGSGILASQKTKLFSEGYSTGGSTGYGLYLIKKMTENYGWTIQEAGEPGKGARFVIQIPKRNASGNENYRIAQ
jgi:signal transduction histidine kinase